MNTKKLLTTIITLISIPIVSAYSWGGYYGSPLDYLDNEWVRFATIFLILFAIIYFAMSKSLKGNTGVAVIVAGGITLLITIALSQRGLLYSYAGDQLGSWITIIAVLIGIGFLLKVAFENFGAPGAILSVLIIWMLMFFSDPYDILPYELSNSAFVGIYNFFSTGFGLVILIVLAVVFSKMISGEKTPAERMMDNLFRRRR